MSYCASSRPYQPFFDSHTAPVNIETFVPALAIILGAYFIRGITGFGSGLIAVPLLTLILPPHTVVPLVKVSG